MFEIVIIKKEEKLFILRCNKAESINIHLYVVELEKKAHHRKEKYEKKEIRIELFG